jgi:hypothetical protein
MLAARYRLPAVYPFRFFTELGGLLSFGNDLIDQSRQAATYADRILKGAKPSELPVQAPVKFDLVINFKTASGSSADKRCNPAKISCANPAAFPGTTTSAASLSLLTAGCMSLILSSSLHCRFPGQSS